MPTWRMLTVDLEIVWKTIHHDLPSLHAQIQGAQESVRTHNSKGMES